ncbi:hypothetical protein BJ508DRAFT_11460 [Ascobolus immersus RN42]|uniref:Uncharacterized protein n=1 Tax=Ascobolus immersus RN42 TaxID=1160509 RepID=A0A3N4HQX4_ASCIM|nr:hypothetical protein BJ508DRAFT_11460 [Ascobolus immersus RN42]
MVPSFVQAAKMAIFCLTQAVCQFFIMASLPMVRSNSSASSVRGHYFQQTTCKTRVHLRLQEPSPVRAHSGHQQILAPTGFSLPKATLRSEESFPI